ncbi:MAG: hypothetical protein KF852_07345 [Saprospiraceae bacterium]|nr:hypothetical protein [Saprospiraceae bacterium]
MKPLAFYTLIIVVGAFSACQLAGNKQPAVYGSFLIRYMEQGSQINARASFFEGDTLATAQPKTWEGGVAFIGSAMELRNMTGSEQRYSAERQLDFLDNYNFRFTDDRGKVRELKAAFNPIGDIGFKSPVSKQSGLVFAHSGAPLAAGETLVLLMTDVSGQSRSITIAGPQRGNEIILPATDVAALRPGALQMYALRKSASASRDGKFEYSVEMEYYTKAVSIDLLP